ncbi:sigma-70 family RNA polymerase sigma factor [Curtobacterium sp. RRHDQ10]|uniref:sigma-70 family RNA polymerase sigma factor n=1 Tax=Curtobacterium phyllosphaerae TaxID=3413379 RepID=UPI003BF21CAE
MAVRPAPRRVWSTESDEALLAGIRDGDRLAFAELYRRMSRQLLAYVQRRLVDHAQSEEVLQEVFLHVWENAARFDPSRAKVSTWLHRVAHGRAVDRIRSAQAAANRDRRVGIRDHEDVDHSASDRFDAMDDVEELRDALLQLTPLQREAVMLRYLRDLSGVETAQLLGVKVATAKTRARDGLQALRVILEANRDAATPAA